MATQLLHHFLSHGPLHSVGLDVTYVGEQRRVSQQYETIAHQ